MHDTTTTDAGNGSHTTDSLQETFTVTIGEVISTEEAAESAEPHLSERPTVPLGQPPKRYFRPNWSLLVAFFLLLILAVEHVPSLIHFVQTTYFPQQATVTLFLSTQKVSHRYSFLAVTGNADSSYNQIPSRILTTTTPTITTTIKTTGTGYTPPTQATGAVTFYNAAIYSQTISAGTVLTGTDGIEVVTDQPAFIGAGNPPIEAQATVSAHTIQAGTRANILPLDINGLCCVAGISVKNTGYFAGGEDPKSYPMLSHADVDLTVKKVVTTLDKEGRKSVADQIQPNETQLTSLACTLHLSSQPPARHRQPSLIAGSIHTHWQSSQQVPGHWHSHRPNG